MLVQRLLTALLGPGMKGRLRRILLVQAVALFAVLQFDYPVAADPTVGDNGAYTLAPGDRISVAVFGQPELSGDFLIDGAGNILLPFVGAVTVKDQTVLECQKTIVARLADGILVHPSVSVRISDLRPLYILGDVRNPGAYPFRYGSTAKGAVALAGGYGVSEATQNAAVSDFVQADERVRTLTLQRLALLVRIARLEAQREGAATFVPPATLSAQAGDDDAGVSQADIVAIEQQTFDAQEEILKAQRKLLTSQKPRIENEIAAINGQIGAGKRQVDLITQEAEQYGHLVKQGLGVTNLEMQLKVLQASHESDVWGLTAQISRLEMEAGELDFKLQELDAAFKKQVMTDLREARYRLKEIEVALVSAKELRDVRLRQTDGLAGAEAAHSITVTRNRNGATSVLQAAEAMILEPGDVVEVKRSPLPFPSHSLSAPSSRINPTVGPGSSTVGRLDPAAAPIAGLRSYASQAILGADRPQSAQPEAAPLGRP